MNVTIEPQLAGLKKYVDELGTKTITADGSKVKIGKFIALKAPNSQIAVRVRDKISEVFAEECAKTTQIITETESVFTNMQTDLFKGGE